MSNPPSAKDESAFELVARTLRDAQSTSVIQNVSAFLDALKMHPDRKRLTDEILHEWYRQIYGGDYSADLKVQKRKAEFLTDLMDRWYSYRWNLRATKALTRPKYIVEVAKWFWLRHRLEASSWIGTAEKKRIRA